MSTTRTLTQALATLAVGAAAGATTYVLMPAASAGVEAATTSSISTTADDPDGPRCAPWGLGTGEVPTWVEDRLDDLPAELREDLEAAWRIEDRSERRDAFRAIREAAEAGEYGAEVQQHAEELGEGRGPGSGWRGPRGWHRHWGS